MMARLCRSIRSRSVNAAGQDGVTLVELLVVMMLMIVVMGAIFTVWSRLEHTYLFTEDDIRAQEQARMALGEMVEFIRTARTPASVTSEVLDAPIPKATPEEIWIWTDVDRDASHTLELVRFYLSTVGTNSYLLRQESPSKDGNFTSTAVRIVNENIRNDPAGTPIASPVKPMFKYYDSGGSQLTPNATTRSVDVTQIRSIRIHLMVDIDPNRAPVVHELTSVVQPRNLRTY